MLISKFGLSGYGYYWCLVELAASSGAEYRVRAEKEWKFYFKKLLEIETENQNDILEYLAETKLIDKKSLLKGDLYIPSLEERSDEYTDKLRRKSRQGRDNVRLDKIRIDKNRLEDIREDSEGKSPPSQIAKKFFSDKNLQNQVIQKISDKYNTDINAVTREIGKFVDYWTESNKSGTRQKWETQATFEVDRRIKRWLENVKGFQKQERKIL